MLKYKTAGFGLLLLLITLLFVLYILIEKVFL